MITHYGLFWSERDIFWGKPKKEGKMLGQELSGNHYVKRMDPVKDESDKIKNFRDYVGLYCLYGDGNLIYIGEAGLGNQGTLFLRIRQHKKGPMAGRWDSFSWFGRENCDGKTETEKALKQLEAIAIAIINPGFNKQKGAFKEAKEVSQVSHTEAEGDMETKLENLEKMIKELANKMKK